MSLRNIITDLLNLPGKEYLRDDDRRLMVNIWHWQLINELNYDPKKITAFQLMALIAEGKLWHFESIRRERQKIQEENELLRGQRYIDRKALAEETKLTKKIFGEIRLPYKD